MIHLDPKLSEFVSSWLDDITDDKGDNERKKFMHSSLREVANQWQMPWMKLQVDGSIETSKGRLMKEEVEVQKLIDEENNGVTKDVLVLGEKMAEKLQQAYSLVSKMNPVVGKNTINEWARKIIEEKIVMKKAEQGGRDMEREEAELYKAEEEKKKL